MSIYGFFAADLLYNLTEPHDIKCDIKNEEFLKNEKQV